MFIFLYLLITVFFFIISLFEPYCLFIAIPLLVLFLASRYIFTGTGTGGVY